MDIICKTGEGETDMLRNDKDSIIFLSYQLYHSKCESTIEIERFYSMHLIPCISPLEAGRKVLFSVEGISSCCQLSGYAELISFSPLLLACHISGVR